MAIGVTADWDFFLLKQFSSNLMIHEKNRNVLSKFSLSSKFILGPIHSCLRTAIFLVNLHVTNPLLGLCGHCWVLKALTSLTWGLPNPCPWARSCISAQPWVSASSFAPALPGRGPCWAGDWSIVWFCGMTWDLPCHCGPVLQSWGCAWTWLPSLDLILTCWLTS